MGTNNFMKTRSVGKKIHNIIQGRTDTIVCSFPRNENNVMIFEGIRTIAQKIITMYDRARRRCDFSFSFGSYTRG